MLRCKLHMPYVCQISIRTLEGLNCALRRDPSLFLMNYFVLLNKKYRKARPLCLLRPIQGRQVGGRHSEKQRDDNGSQEKDEGARKSLVRITREGKWGLMEKG